MYYNILLPKEISFILALYGYQIAKAIRLNIDIPESKNKDEMATCTQPLANGCKKVKF